MQKRVEGCTAPFGRTENIHFIPACLGGNALAGCVQEETCEKWSRFGEEVVERAREGLGDVITDHLLMVRETLSPEHFREEVHSILDLAISDIEKLIADTNNDLERQASNNSIQSQ